ncbi:MAG: hypothetical protein Q7O66_16685 [Dehalococcoidia bacterium]|nr:hypothetical protein [Dehalococcoidia bacterium]
MAIDTSFGYVSKFEDFQVTAIADLPEIDTLAVGATAVTEIKALGIDGRLNVGVDTSNDDDNAGVSFGLLNWRSGANDLKMEARIFIDSITDNKFFVGFGDSLASADETSFSATTDTVTIDTMSDGIGILFDNDATTKVLWCVAGKTDAVTVNKALGAKYNPVAATALTLGCYLSADRRSACFYVNGEEVYRIDSSTTLVAATDLVPMVQNFEQGTANIISVDYLYGKKGRSTT